MIKRLFLIATFLLFGGCGNENNPTTDVNNSVISQSEYIIDYYRIPMMAWLMESKDRYKFAYKFVDQSIHAYSIENLPYQWGYKYKVTGQVTPHSEDGDEFTLDEIISKEQHFEPFTLTFRTHTIIDGVFNFKEEPLITKTSNDKYLAYNELEFKVYDQDLQENLDLRIDNNYTVTLTFDFEDNGTIFLKQIEE